MAGGGGQCVWTETGHPGGMAWGSRGVILEDQVFQCFVICGEMEGVKQLTVCVEGLSVAVAGEEGVRAIGVVDPDHPFAVEEAGIDGTQSDEERIVKFQGSEIRQESFQAFRRQGPVRGMVVVEAGAR